MGVSKHIRRSFSESEDDDKSNEFVFYSLFLIIILTLLASFYSFVFFIYLVLYASVIYLIIELLITKELFPIGIFSLFIIQIFFFCGGCFLFLFKSDYNPYYNVWLVASAIAVILQICIGVYLFFKKNRESDDIGEYSSNFSNFDESRYSTTRYPIQEDLDRFNDYNNEITQNSRIKLNTSSNYVGNNRSRSEKNPNNILQNNEPIPEYILTTALERVESIHTTLPFTYRGIPITPSLIAATMEILNNEPTKTLPQNCRNDIRERTPDGLDRRIKEYFQSDLRTANIITDILEEAGIVTNVDVPSAYSNGYIKGTHLNQRWTW